MTIEEIIQICKERKELDFLYDLTKIVAESDSIGEGWGYCGNYTKEEFHNEFILTNDDPAVYDSYLHQAGISLYERYLEQIKVLHPVLK